MVQKEITMDELCYFSTSVSKKERFLLMSLFGWNY